MGLLLIAPEKISKNWEKALLQQYPEINLNIFPDIENQEKITFALAWNHPEGVFQQFPNLKVVASMGAGVDHILKDKTLSEDIIVTRMVDKQLAKDMGAFVLAVVMDYIRGLSFYKMHKIPREWNPKKYCRPSETKIGIMGMGALGTAAGRTFAKNDFIVQGWANSEKNIPDIKVFVGKDQLNRFLSDTDILICLLPLTPETENILNAELFEQLPKDAYVINVARGKHLVEEDLLKMIEEGHLSGAALDVFREEPLPKNHSFWKQSRINITPHIASVSNPADLIPQLMENYLRMQQNEPLLNVVDRNKGY